LLICNLEPIDVLLEEEEDEEGMEKKIGNSSRKISCLKCKTFYDIPEQKISPHGLNIICSKCGSVIQVSPENVDPVIKEAQQGAPPISLINCPHCGKLVSPDTKNCPMCNGRISYAVPLPKPIVPVSPTEQQKYFGILILIAGIVGFVIPPVGLGAFIFAAIQLSKAKNNPLLYQDSLIYLRIVFWGYLGLLGLIIVAVLIILLISAVANIR